MTYAQSNPLSSVDGMTFTEQSHFHDLIPSWTVLGTLPF